MWKLLATTSAIMERILKRSLGLLTILLFIIDLYCVHGGTVTTSNQIGLLGPNQVEVRCEFTVGTGEVFERLELHRKRSGVYTQITSYRRPNVTLYGDSSLQTRTTLLLQENAASLIFNVVECTDEAMYQCKLQVVVNQVVTTVTAEMTLTVNVQPTSTRFTNDLSTPASRLFEENQTLNLECIGEVGKPAGNFVWFAYRKNGQVLDMTSQAMHNPPYKSGCGFGRVSQLSITFNRLDNGLTVRCATNQTTLGIPPTSSDQCNATKCTQTDRISVLFSINQEDVVVNSYPSYSQHIVGSTVRLTCTAKGNPAPEFRWQKNGDENNTKNANEWSLSNLQKEDSGTYTCFVSNTVSGTIYNASKSINIDVVATTTTSTTTPTPRTTVKPGNGKTDALNPTTPGTDNQTTIIIVVVVVVLVLLIVIAIAVFIIYKKKKAKSEVEEPPEKPYNNHTFNTYNTKPDLVTGDEKKHSYGNKSDDGLTYADLKFDDKPRSRRPVALADNMTDYADIDIMQV